MVNRCTCTIQLHSHELAICIVLQSEDQNTEWSWCLAILTVLSVIAVFLFPPLGINSLVWSCIVSDHMLNVIAYSYVST